jgi:FkbM family methyltransferase
MIDYSQHGEQAHILAYFAGHQGTFLDIGANDGVTFSNSYALQLMGWRGTLVDASPVAIARLRHTYAGVATVKVIHAAITDHDGDVTLHDSSDTLVSSLSPTAEQTWRHHNFSWHAAQVPAMTVATLYQQAGTDAFDFVTIDAEGHDLTIMRQLNLEPVKMLCVEYGTHRREVVAAAPGFKVLVDNGVNVIMAR